MRSVWVVLCRGRKAPQKTPSCRSCCPVSKTEPSVQRVMAEVGSVDEVMREVRISWKGGSIF